MNNFNNIFNNFNFKDINLDNTFKLCEYDKNLTPENSKNDHIKLCPISTLEYRTSSTLERSISTAKKEKNISTAKILSAKKGISVDDAMQEINPNWNEEKWTLIELNDNDSKIGEEFTTESLSICCNSLLTDKIYNDTIGIFNEKGVSYKDRYNDYMIHSGDILTPFGLRHKIEFKKEYIGSEDYVGYIISSPWLAGKSYPISSLIKTNPILEIRTEDNDNKKRFVIANDYSNGDNFTACVNAKITYKNNLWTIKIVKKFINGYADELEKIISELINF